MADTDKLQDMLDNLINQKSEQAQVDFHSYLQGKMQDIIHAQTDDQTEVADEE